MYLVTPAQIATVLRLIALKADPNVDGILVLLTPQAMTEIEATAQAVRDLSNGRRKANHCLLHGRGTYEAGVDALTTNGVPNYAFP